MIEFLDTAPTVDVQPAEYIRLLGYPRGRVLEDRAMELAELARSWYAKHGRPWIYAREADAVDAHRDAIRIDGVPFSSTRLRNTLQAAGAHSAVLVAVSAGSEIEAEAQVRWRDERPDEYFFLETYGSAVVEHLVTTTGARLCAWADGERAAVLPHDSPGYPEWRVEEQAVLLEVIRRGTKKTIPLDVFDSGMLRPKKSLLAVFGVTRNIHRVRSLSELSPCEKCSYSPCQYRRSPYRRAPQSSERGLAAASGEAAIVSAPLDTAANYSVSLKALHRWSEQRLTLSTRPDGSVEAVFKYEGTTCTNSGRPLHFDYHVTLGPREEGYPILQQRCGPAAGDEGYRSMCRYLRDGEPLMTAIASERPLHGQRLDDVVRWTRSANPAGCYCEAESRQHKWGLVLETIHYALAREPHREDRSVSNRVEPWLEGA